MVCTKRVGIDLDGNRSGGNCDYTKKKSKSKQIFTDRVRNDRDKYDRSRNDRVRNDRGLEIIGLEMIGLEMIVNLPKDMSTF